MKILVTGGSGFIGKRLISYLSTDNEDNDIYNLDLVKSPSLPDEKQRIENLVETNVKESFFDGFDMVIHLAAMVSVQKSIKDPINSFDNNVRATLKALEICRFHNIKQIVFSSSCAVYGYKERLVGNNEGIFSEDCNANPVTPYGLDKLTSEKYIHLYSQIYGINYLICRFFNVYGEGQNPKYAGVISLFQKAKENNLPLVIYGDGEQTRDFIYVENVVRTVCALIDKPMKAMPNQIFNVGSGRSISINQLAEKFSNNIIHKEARKETRHVWADIRKTTWVLGRKDLDFFPKDGILI